MTQTIRWGIIGVGNVTEVKSGPGFQKANGSELVAVMRRTGALAKDYAERHGVPKWYDDAESLINDPDVDAVYIATPPHMHKEHTLMSAAAGKPVYVEKPMALNYEECQDMIAACAASDVHLWVAYYRRRLPRFLKIKELLDSNAIGQVVSVNTVLDRLPDTLDPANLPWRVLPEFSGGGLFVDVGSHTLDLLDYFLGPIKAVRGFADNHGSPYPAEDHVSISFAFESGTLGTGNWCFCAGQHNDRTELLGTRGKIIFATFDNVPVRLITENGEQQFEIEHPPHIQQPLIQSIVDEMNRGGNCPSSGVSGARTTWIIDQALVEYRRKSPHIYGLI